MHKARTVRDAAIRTFTTGSLANGSKRGKKKAEKSDTEMPEAINAEHVCAKLREQVGK